MFIYVDLHSIIYNRTNLLTKTYRARVNKMSKSNYKTLDEFFRAEKKNIMKPAKSMFFNCENGVLTITCPDNSKVVLTREDFPNRDLIACYKFVDGKTVFDHYEQGTHPALNLSCGAMGGITA
jgi:hypothetical protein